MIYDAFAIIAEQQAAGVDGGDFNTGAWRTRTFNTEVFDPDGIVSISANQFTLQAGTYEIYALGPAILCSSVASRIQNITDASTAINFSMNTYSSTGRAQGNYARIMGRVTIASAKAFEFQQANTWTKTVNGFGVSQSWSTNQYATLLIRRVASSGTRPDFAIIADQQTSGTAAQSIGTASRTTRNLNTLVDPDGIVTSLSANQFTLPAGKYELMWNSMLWLPNKSASWIHNVTDGVDIGLDASSYAGASVFLGGISSGVTGFTLASPKTFEMQTRFTSAGSGGIATSWGTECYANILLTKYKEPMIRKQG